MLFTYFNSDRAHKRRTRTLILFIFLFSLNALSSCRKEREKGNPATLQVFNAMDDRVRLYANLTGNHPVNYNGSLLVNNKMYMLNGNLLNIIRSPQQIDFYAQPDTMAHDKPVLSINATLNGGEIYSLFIYGDKSTAAYTLHHDKIPAINRQDSTTFIRFANFSEAQAISVNMQGKPTGSFIQSLPFKSLSDFVELKADVSMPDYVFEVRNQATGNLLTTFTTFGMNPLNSWPGSVNQYIFKSNTLVFAGKPGSPFPNNQSITLMNHR